MSPRTVHIVPSGDLIEHDTDTFDADCVCGPTTEARKGDDGSVGWVLIHHALDARKTSAR